MHVYGKTKLGFFPLPVSEAKRLRNYLAFSSHSSAVDPCVGDGVAFSGVVEGAPMRRYGIEIDAHRAAQARTLAIEVLQANTMDVRCNAESFSLVYLNPPYDWESGQTGNQRLESVFLEHTYRWLQPDGVLVFVIPQPRLKPCAPTIDINSDVHEVRAHQADPDIVVAASAIGLCISRDAGATWIIERDSLHASYCSAVAFSGDDILVSASTDHFAAQGKLYRRPIRPNGDIVAVEGGLPAWTEGIVDTGCIAANGSSIAVADRAGNLYRSADSGQT